MNAFNNVCFSFALACCDERRDAAVETRNAFHLLAAFGSRSYSCQVRQHADECTLPTSNSDQRQSLTTAAKDSSKSIS
ncbi:hypothetical protein KCU93_g353, partial [Aureobasidium melanogenum]